MSLLMYLGGFLGGSVMFFERCVSSCALVKAFLRARRSSKYTKRGWLREVGPDI